MSERVLKSNGVNNKLVDELLGSGLFRRSSCSSKGLRVFLFFEFEDFDVEFLGALRLESEKTL